MKKIKCKLLNNLDDDSKFSIFEVIVIILIAMIFGIIVGCLLTYTNKSIYNDDKLNEIINTYNSIKDNYYDNIDEDTLVNGAVNGMIDSLGDNYSNYMGDEATEDFTKSVDGSFIGIGVSVLFDGEYNKIVEVDVNGPAFKAGLKKDDVILSVDGKDTKGVYGNNLTKLVNGKKNTKVKIKVKRGDTVKTYSVVRKLIEIESVTSDIFKENNKIIGYIDVDIIASNTYEQFKKNLDKLEKQNIDSLVIDLRDNPGGHLSQTKEILSLFFDKKIVLYQVRDKNKTKKVYATGNISKKYPIVILVNEESASAAEIITASFKENYKNCMVVGTNTYGKGTVQQTIKLSTGTSIKYTIEEWLTPKGKNINKVGIKPDVELKQSQDYLMKPSYENDSQLQGALKILKKKTS